MLDIAGGGEEIIQGKPGCGWLKKRMAEDFQCRKGTAAADRKLYLFAFISHAKAHRSVTATELDLNGLLQRLPLLFRLRNRLGTHDAPAPVTLRLLVLLGVAFLDGGDEFGELGLVFRADFCDGENGRGLSHTKPLANISLDCPST